MSTNNNNDLPAQIAVAKAELEIAQDRLAHLERLAEAPEPHEVMKHLASVMCTIEGYRVIRCEDSEIVLQHMASGQRYCMDMVSVHSGYGDPEQEAHG